jgi:hypothetical protein
MKKKIHFQWLLESEKKIYIYRMVSRKRLKQHMKPKLNKTTQAIAREHFSLNLAFDRDGLFLLI